MTSHIKAINDCKEELSIIKDRIINILENWEPEFNKTNFRTMLIKDGFGEINFIELFQQFNRISLDSR